MTTENPPMKGKWIDLINESVHTVDDIDIGDIDAVNIDFIVVKRGFVNVHYYYIPIHRVEGWDGHVMWLKITESEAKSKYEKDIVPDPSRYYVKDYPYYAATNYPELLIIQPRHKDLSSLLLLLQICQLYTNVIYVTRLCKVEKN